MCGYQQWDSPSSNVKLQWSIQPRHTQLALDHVTHLNYRSMYIWLPTELDNMIWSFTFDSTFNHNIWSFWSFESITSHCESDIRYFTLMNKPLKTNPAGIKMVYLHFCLLQMLYLHGYANVGSYLCDYISVPWPHECSLPWAPIGVMPCQYLYIHNFQVLIMGSPILFNQSHYLHFCLLQMLYLHGDSMLLS